MVSQQITARLKPFSLGAVSIICCIVTNSFHLVSTLSPLFIVLAAFCLIIATTVNSWWWRSALIVASLILWGYVFYEQRTISESSSRKELISDATESLVDYYTDIHHGFDTGKEWINEENLLNGTISFFLVPVSKIDEFLVYMYNDAAVLKDDPQNGIIRYHSLITSQQGVASNSDYQVVLTYSPHLHSKREFKGSIKLPSSTSSVLAANHEFDGYNWASGRELLEKAQIEGNASAAYYLSHYYRYGYGRAPDEKQAEKLLRMSAESGSRSARFEWGNSVLKDSTLSMTGMNKSVAEDFLKKAASLKKSTVTKTTGTLSRNSILLLNDFYRACAQESNNRKYYTKAYNLTKKSNGSFEDVRIKYSAHLDNCIILENYDEALKIIDEGKGLKVKRGGKLESIPQAHCFLVEADMYMRGLGVSHNFTKAEKLLRFAADSLDYYPAYRGMAELYRKRGKAGDEFWDRLYEVKFSNRID